MVSRQGSIPEEESEQPGHAMRTSRPPALDIGSVLSSPSSAGGLAVMPGSSVAGVSPGSTTVELSPMSHTPPPAARRGGEDAEAPVLQASPGRAAPRQPPQLQAAATVAAVPVAPQSRPPKRGAELNEVDSLELLAAQLHDGSTDSAGGAVAVDIAEGAELYSPFASIQALSEDLLREVSQASARRITRTSTGSGLAVAAGAGAGGPAGVGAGAAPRDAAQALGAGVKDLKPGTVATGGASLGGEAVMSGGTAVQSGDSHCTAAQSMGSSQGKPHSSLASSDAHTVSTSTMLQSVRMSQNASYSVQKLDSSSADAQRPSARPAVPPASGLNSPAAAALAAASSPPAGLRPLRVPASSAAAAASTASELGGGGGGNRPPRELNLAMQPSQASGGGADAPSEALRMHGGAPSSTYSGAISGLGLMLDLESGFGSPLPSFDVVTGAMMRPLNSMGSAGGSTAGHGSSQHGGSIQLLAGSVLLHSQSVGGVSTASLLAPERPPLQLNMHSGGVVSASLTGLTMPAALLPPSPPGSSRRASHLRPAAVQALIAREMSGGSLHGSASITAASLADGMVGSMVGSPTGAGGALGLEAGDIGATTGSASMGGAGDGSASSHAPPSVGLLLRGGSGRASNATGPFSSSLLGRRHSHSTGQLDGGGGGSLTMATPLVLGVVDMRQSQGRGSSSSTTQDMEDGEAERESVVEVDTGPGAVAGVVQAAAPAAAAEAVVAARSQAAAAAAALASEETGDELQPARVDAAGAAQSHAAAWRAAQQQAIAAAQVSAATANAAASARSLSGGTRTAVHGSSFGGGFSYGEDDDGEDASLYYDGDRPSVATVNFSDRTSAFSLRSLQSGTDRTSAFSYFGPSAFNTASGWASGRPSDRSIRSHLSASARASRDAAAGSPHAGASRTSAGEGDGDSELSTEEQLLLWRRPPGGFQGGGGAAAAAAAANRAFTRNAAGQRSFTANTRPGAALSPPALAAMFSGGSAQEPAAAGARVLDQRRSRSLTVRAGARAAAAAADDASEPSSSGQGTETGAVLLEEARLWQEPPFPHGHARSARRGGSSAMNFGAMSVVPEMEGEEHSGGLVGHHSSEAVSGAGLAAAAPAGEAQGEAVELEWGRAVAGPIRLGMQAPRADADVGLGPEAVGHAVEAGIGAGAPLRQMAGEQQ